MSQNHKNLQAVLKKRHTYDVIQADSFMALVTYRQRFIQLPGDDCGRYNGTDCCDLLEGDYLVREQSGWKIYTPEKFNKKFNVV